MNPCAQVATLKWHFPDENLTRGLSGVERITPPTAGSIPNAACDGPANPGDRSEPDVLPDFLADDSPASIGGALDVVWYYCDEGHIFGPTTLDAIWKLLAAGCITTSTKVRCEGDDAWIRLSSQPELLPAIPSVARTRRALETLDYSVAAMAEFPGERSRELGSSRRSSNGLLALLIVGLLLLASNWTLWHATATLANTKSLAREQIRATHAFWGAIREAEARRVAAETAAREQRSRLEAVARANRLAAEKALRQVQALELERKASVLALARVAEAPGPSTGWQQAVARIPAR